MAYAKTKAMWRAPAFWKLGSIKRNNASGISSRRAGKSDSSSCQQLNALTKSRRVATKGITYATTTKLGSADQWSLDDRTQLGKLGQAFHRKGVSRYRQELARNGR